MTTTYDAKPLTAETEIAAAPERVWALVSDLRRMSRWSPQVVRTFVRGGAVRLGSKAVNVNRSGWKVWPTQSRVVAFEPGRLITFRVADNWLHWTYELAPAAGGGTVVRVTRTAPDGLSPVSARFQKAFMGGAETFDREVLAGMETTLERIRAEVEAPARS